MALVVIGGVAGLSAAARARRIDPRLEIIVLEKGPVISYGACGLPYYVEGRVREVAELITYTPEYFRKQRNIDVRTGARVVGISHPRREVVLASGSKVAYEKLVIATGARGGMPNLPGAQLPHVFRLYTLDDAEGAPLRSRAKAEVRGGGGCRIHWCGGGGRTAAQRPAGDCSGKLRRLRWCATMRSLRRRCDGNWSVTAWSCARVLR